jgi:iron complex outermembrane receptor protein
MENNKVQKRNTRTKTLVMDVLKRAKVALSNEEIESRLKVSMDRVTLYRILQSFNQDGKIHKIVADDGKSYYALCHSCSEEHHHDNHVHFKCEKCDKVMCLDKKVKVPVLPEGYRAASYSFFMNGLCSKCSALCVTFLLFFASVNAQSDTVHRLQEVTVSTSSLRIQSENVANVESIPLNKGINHGLSLGDKLKEIHGVDNLSTGAGIGKPVIRGLSGNRVAVFSQGIRIENQQWGDEHGLGLDENGYEHVEVIKGPASLLYGSDALGGVIYFIDEGYAKDNSFEAAINSEFYSNTLGLRNSGAFKVSKKNFHFNIFGGYTTHRDYSDGYNNLVPNSRFNTGDVKTSFGYTGKRFTTSVKYNFLNEKYGLTEHEHEDEDEDEEHEEHEYKNGRTMEMPYQHLMTHIAAWNSVFFFDNNSKLKVDFGYVFNNRKEFEHEHEHGEEEHGEEHEHEGEHEDEAALNMNLNTFSYAAKWYSPKWNKWTLTTGTMGMAQTNTNHGEEILIPNAVTVDVGVFAMSDFYYSDKAYWQTGIRFDNRHIQTGDNSFNKNYFAFNFSTGIYQPIVKNFSLRINFSSGFRAPNTYELLSDGIHHGTNRYETGNINLKTENSYQADMSLNYKSTHLEIFVSPYFNYIRNFIFLQPTGMQVEGTSVYDYVQKDAFLFGGEAGVHFHPHPLDWLHLECSYSNTFGQSTHRDFLPLMPSQKLKTNLSVIFTSKTVVKKYSFYVQNIFSLAQNRIAEYETTTPNYDLLDVGANLEFQFGKQKLGLSFAVTNILNTKYYDHLSRYKAENIYNMGRNFVVKVSIPIEFPN